MGTFSNLYTRRKYSVQRMATKVQPKLNIYLFKEYANINFKKVTCSAVGTCGQNRQGNRDG